MGQWTSQGFVANELSYYKSMVQNVFLEAFGTDFDLNENLPQGVLIQRLAELFYGMDMDGVQAFSHLNLNTMEGRFLDIVGALRGIPRILGTPQTGIATVTCNPDTFVAFTIPQGTVLTVLETNDKFVVARNTTFTSAEGTIEIDYSENGDSSAIIGNTMSVDGFSQIQNIEIISLFSGAENESDIAYRARIQNEYPAAVGTIEYVNNQLRALDMVRSVGCLYNDTTETVDTIPPYCTEWMVVPASTVDADSLPVFKNRVAEVILDNKVPGSPTHGNTTVTVADVFGTQKAVNFTIATEVAIEIEVTVATPESTGIFNLTNVPEIKLAIAAYVNNLEIGKDVSFSRCMAPLTADVGFDVINFKMKEKTSDTWTENGNLTVGAREYATLSVDDITVSV